MNDDHAWDLPLSSTNPQHRIDHRRIDRRRADRIDITYIAPVDNIVLFHQLVFGDKHSMIRLPGETTIAGKSITVCANTDLHNAKQIHLTVISTANNSETIELKITTNALSADNPETEFHDKVYEIEITPKVSMQSDAKLIKFMNKI